jgi:hypothetical protein
MEQSHEEENDFKALKIPLDPALAVASMLKLEAEGWKFHQLRREVAETLDVRVDERADVRGDQSGDSARASRVKRARRKRRRPAGARFARVPRQE